MKKNIRGIISIFVIMFMFIFLIACDLSNNSNIETLNVTFEDKTFTYDGNIHNIDINGILPEGVTVEYYYNGSKFTGIKEPGTYTIVAKFTDTTGKYKLNDLVANITIKEEEVSIDFDTDLIYGTTETYEFDGVRRWGNVIFDEKLGLDIIKDIKVNYYYQGKEFYGAMLPGNYEIIGKVYYKDVFIKEVPTKLIIEYNEEIAKNLFTYEDITTTYNGNVIYFEAQTNVRDLKFDYYSNDATYAFAIDPGEYVFNLVFVDALTGEKFDPNISKKLTILPLENNELNLSDYPEIYFKTVTIDYDGNYQMINLAGDDVYNLPDYVLIEYYCNGELFDGASECGIYDIQAILTNKTKTNYYGSFDARMTIRKTFDISNITYNDRNITYDGIERNIVIKGRVPEDLDVIYYKIDDPSILNGIKPNQISKLNLEQLNIPTVKDPGDYYFVASFVPNVQYQIMTYPNYIVCHVNVSQIDFDANLVSFEDKSVIYDGSLKNITIENLPDNFEISYYLGDESFAGAINVGTYNIKAVITDSSGIYKNIPDFYAILEINKARYVTNFKFENKSYVYDGLEKEILIEGNLPNGVTVSYENNKLINAGQIKAKAIFTNSNPNYYDISTKEATLTIEKASVYGITFESHSYVYDGLEHNILIDGNLPDGVSVNYYCNDSIFTGATNANSYYITAKFTDSTGNYSVPFDMTASLNISKARYDMSNIYFNDHYYTYDGSEKELLIDGTLPSGLTAVYENNRLTDVGYVRAKVSFISNNPNYEEVQSKEAYLVIEKANIGDISFKNQTITYDGKVHNIAIEGTLPDGVLVNYYIETSNELFEGATNVGWYGITARFTDTTGNYNNLDSLYAILIIDKATVEQTIEFESKTFVYDGTLKNIEIKTYINDAIEGKISSELPDEIEVQYYLTYNNSLFAGATHAGKYSIEARFINKTENYNSIDSIFATLTIERINYDLSTFSFKSAEYIYDGSEKELTIEGTLPEGLSVSYSENKMTNVYTLEVYAYFYNENSNYNDVDAMVATLTIKPKTITGLSLPSKEVTYNGLEHSLAVEGIDTNEVYANYYYNDEIYNNGVVNAGLYDVKAILKCDTGNYTFDNNTLVAKLTINKATYDMSGIIFESKTETYDTGSHSIYISGKLNYNLQVEYDNNIQVNAGEYIVTARFKNSNSNYNDPEAMTAKLTILKADYSKYINLNPDTTYGYVYDGKKHNLPYNFNNYFGIIVTYYCNNEIFEGATNAGSYDILIHFEDTSGNFNVPDDVPNNLTIEKANYQLDISFPSKSYEYDGNEHYIYIEGDLPDGLTVSYENNSLKNVGSIYAYASFTNSNSNYNDYKIVYSAILTITNQNVGFTYIFDETSNTYMITGIGTYDKSELVLPEYINGVLVTKLAYKCFENCDFQTAIIHENITLIGTDAFSNCKNLESIIIPSSLEYIGEYAFINCTNLKDVYYKGNIHDWFKIDISHKGNPMQYASNFYEYDKENSILNDEDVYVRLYRIIFDESYTKILTNWNLGYFNLRYVTLNDNITEIEAKAFADCTNLVGIDLPSNLISIGNYAFANCKSITSVIVPNSVQTIGTGAFSGCVNLEFIKLPFVGEQRLTDESEHCYPFGHIFTSYEEFGEFNAEELNNVTQLVKIDNGFNTIQCYIPKKLTYVEITDTKIIPFGAFSYLENLTTIKVNYEVEIIEQWAFLDCKNIKTFEMPTELISIGKSAFENCTNLYNISFNKKIETIEDSAFAYCTSLENVILPDGVKTIGESAFIGCSISYLNLSDSIEKISNSAFSGNDLTNLQLPENLKVLETCAFSGNEINNLSFYGKIEKLGKYIFDDTIENVYFNGTYENWFDIQIKNKLISNLNANFYIYDKNGNVEYKGNTYSYLSTLYLGDDGYYELSEYKNITELIFDDSIENVSIYNSTIKKITIPSSIQSIYVINNCEIDTIYCNSSIFDFLKIDVNYKSYESFENIKHIYFYDENGTIGYNGKKYIELKEITIPIDFCEENYSFIHGLSIIKSIETLNFENGIETILYGARYNNNIINVNIPDTVKYISNNAFTGCDNIVDVKIPDSVIEIGDYAFAGCVNLKYLTISKNIQTIGRQAFSNAKITRIDLPDSITNIAENAFYDCPLDLVYVPANCCKAVSCKTLKSLNITSGETIEARALSTSYNLSQLYLPATLTSIGENAFFSCHKLVEIYNKSQIEMHYGETTNGYVSFYAKQFHTNFNDESILNYYDDFEYYVKDSKCFIIDYLGDKRNLVLPSKVYDYDHGYMNYDIADYAFYSKNNLLSVEIPSGVTSIGSFAFQGCNNLRNIVIPSTVTYMSTYSLMGCSRLVEMFNYSELDIKPNNSNYIVDNLLVIHNKKEDSKIIKNGDYYYIDVNGEYYLFDYVGKETDITLPSNINGNIYIIAEAAFSNRGLTNVVIPDGVKKICNDAFRDNNVMNITLPNTLEELGNSVFINVYPECNIYDNGYYLGSEENPYLLFYAPVSTDIDTIKIHEDTKIIYSWAFDNFSNVTEIRLPKGIKNLGAGCFYGLSSLENFYYDGTIEDWFNVIQNSSSSNPMFNATNFYIIDENGDVEYEGNKYSKVTSITIPDTISIINKYQFRYFSNLDSIILGNNVSEIGEYAFTGCDSITTMIIPDNLTKIDEHAFSNCSSLEYIVLPESINYLGHYIAGNCSSLKAYCYKGTKEELDQIEYRFIEDYYEISSKALYYTENGELETEVGHWWYYDTDGSIKELTIEPAND